MKFFSIITALIFFGSSVLFAQTPPSNTPAIPGMQNTARTENFSTEITLIDPHGKPFNRVANGVEGTPFLVEEFNAGLITLNNGKKIKLPSIRVDIERQTLHYLNKNAEMEASAGLVKEVEFIDSINTKLYKLRTGFARIDNQDENSFYEVLADGPLYMLKSNNKKLNITKNELSGEVQKRYDLTSLFYVADASGIWRVKKEKDFWLNLLLKNKEKIDQFIRENKINFKNIDDIKKLVAYYNFLLAA